MNLRSIALCPLTVAVAVLLSLSGVATAQIVTFPTVTLSPLQEVPPNPSFATGTGVITLNTATNLMSWSITFSGLSSNQTAAHVHTGLTGANGPVTFNIGVGNPMSGSATLTASQLNDLLAKRFYFNVHTTTFGGGEIRGQIIPHIASANSTGTGCLGVSMTPTGLPTIGNSSFALVVSGATPGSNVFFYGSLGIAATPLAISSTCNVYLDINSLLQLISLGVSPIGPIPAPTGSATLALPIGPSLSALGAAVDLQALVVDPLGGLATTNAISIKIGV